MQLLLTKGWDNNQELVSDNPDETFIEKLMRSLNWEEFNSVTLQQNDENWINVSGNLTQDGFSIVLEENGTTHISENPPNSIDELINALQSYLTGKFSSEFLSTNNLEYLNTKSKEIELWKAQYEAKQKIEKQNYRIAFITAIVLLSLILTLGYLLYNDELKFVGQNTAFGIATVTKTEWKYVRGGAKQLVIYEFQFNGKSYNGNFIGNRFTGKHRVNDRVKIKFSVDDPTISKRVATIRRKKTTHNN